MITRSCKTCGVNFKCFPSNKKTYCSFICVPKLGKLNPHWRGGRIKKQTGYTMIHKPDHPFSDKDGYVLEHRIVMEKFLNRLLLSKEVVHHINNIGNDNRIEKLKLLCNQAEHAKLHNFGRLKNEEGQYI